LVLGVCVSKTIFPHLPSFLVVQRITLFVKNWENGRMNTRDTKAESGKRESGNEGDQSRAQLVVGQASCLKDEFIRGRGRERGRGGLPETLDRAELVAVLEECEVSVKGFDGLRSDAYEKHLAGRSLVELEAFYRRLVYPSVGYGKIRQQCLPWGPGSQYQGKLPTVRTLIDIKERILLEQAVRGRMKAKKLMEVLGSGQVKGEAKELAREYFKVAMEILGEELLVAKAEGKPVMENLRVLDRLMKVAGLRLRERKDAREQTRFGWESEDRKAEAKAKVANKPKPMSQETPRQLIRRIHGCNPFEPEKKPRISRSKKVVNRQPKVKPAPPAAASKPEKIRVAEPPKAEVPKDMRPEWAKRPGNVLIAGPCTAHPKGVRKCPATGDIEDVLTGRLLTAQQLDELRRVDGRNGAPA
jgi:hypothetical protein